MAERKVVNKYYPPDWDPSKGSLNQYVGQHPLRERAKNLHKGILVIRFEMPFNIWCGGCGRHIAMSVRFNADKKKIGMYYSTPIYSFKMNCPSCSNEIELQTDPKNSDYVVAAGGSRKNELWDEEENGTLTFKDEDTAKNLAENPFFKLEHETKDIQAAKKVVPVITQLLDMREQDWKDDAESSKILRKRFREERKRLEKNEAEAKDLQKRASLAIPIVAEAEEDVNKAKKIKFTSASGDNLMKKAAKLKMASIFADPKKSGTGFQLTKGRLEQEKHTMDLALKKKQLGIDHRKFQLLGQPEKKSPLGDGFPLKGLIKPKRPSGENPDIPSTEFTAPDIEDNNDDDDHDDTAADDSHEDGYCDGPDQEETPKSKPGGLLSLVDYGDDEDDD